MKHLVLIFLILLFSSFGFSAVLNDCVCGQANNDNLHSHDISQYINATESSPHEFPWLVFIQALFYETWNHVCGGTIISDKIILTAAHCVNINIETRYFRVLTGVHHIQPNPLVYEEIYKVKHIIPHHSFVYTGLYDVYDLALIVVDRPIMFSPKTQPICLPNPNDDELFWNREAFSVGFVESEDYNDVIVPLESKVRVLDKDTCSIQWTSTVDFYNSDAMMCAKKETKVVCKGEAGGPLFANKGGNHHIILGVASYGKGCVSDVPELYARVPNVETLKWIEYNLDIAQGNVCMSPDMKLQ